MRTCISNNHKLVRKQLMEVLRSNKLITLLGYLEASNAYNKYIYFNHLPIYLIYSVTDGSCKGLVIGNGACFTLGTIAKGWYIS